MIRTNLAASAYRQSQVQGASPVELIVLLYGKAILLLRTAISRLGENRIPEKAQAVSQAVDIIAGLQAILDRDRGGEIAARLNALYSYMLERLTLANYKNDPSLIREVIQLLEELEQGWRGLIRASAAPTVNPQMR